VGEHWTCCDDPTEFITMEPIMVAEFGMETAGFVMLNAHQEGGAIAHDEGVAIIRLSPTVLVVVFFSGHELVIPYDSTIRRFDDSR